MPKSKKRNTAHRGGGSGGGGGGSGADAGTATTAGGQHRNIQPFSDEDASIETMSHCSGYSDPSSFAEDGPEVLDEEGTQEDLEYKLKGFIDLTLDKSAKTRQAALEGLRGALASKLLSEFLLERRMTLTDSIERCLKKGKSDEQRAAAALASVLCVQLGPGIESEEVLKTLGPVLKKIICDGAASTQARQTCATCFGVCCFIATDDISELYAALDCLEGLFSRAGLKDKRKQRSVFRDVLRAVEDRDFPTETVKFGPERMYIDCWVKKHTYDTFKEVLGSGMQYHLQSNEFLRHVFELGPPVMLDAATLKTMKISRFERHLYNSAAFKARTKARSKCRDKRADVGEFF
uniref:Interferon related developmental regulator 1 n=1 Tax=Pipistrellus kuhlii TaxID=59472 RepID=A0A7J7TPH5_PIPKU|nr:interferon related developmental regulator 1 [Pipistrellus kuhlii]